MYKRHCAPGCNKHHLLWPKPDWSTGAKKALRDFWYLKVEIPKMELHEAIHVALPHGIPAPSGKAARHAVELLRIADSRGLLLKCDSMEQRLNILIQVLGNSSPETVETLKEQRACIYRYYKNRF